jgi:hypothetical protein
LRDAIVAQLIPTSAMHGNPGGSTTSPPARHRALC